jgi:hypothetical protein
MADRRAVEAMPYRELVKLAQSVGITDVMMLMPANRQTLIEAVLTVQQKNSEVDTKSGCSLVALVRILAVPAAAACTAALASTDDGKEVLVKAWPSVAIFCECVAPNYPRDCAFRLGSSSVFSSVSRILQSPRRACVLQGCYCSHFADGVR